MTHDLTTYEGGHEMKYIDADRLIVKIERLKEKTCIGIYDKREKNGRLEVLNHLLSTITSLQQERPDIIDYICLGARIHAPFMDGNQWSILKGANIQVGVVGFGDTKEDALINFIKDIPLPQEQPEGLHFTPLNRLIQKIPSEKWNNNTNNYAKKLRDCLIKEGYLKDANVLQGYISYMNGNNVPMATMDKQEQPEVELEKFDKDVTEIWGRCAAEPNDSIACIHIETFNEVARHFYELGINARKEK